MTQSPPPIPSPDPAAGAGTPPVITEDGLLGNRIRLRQPAAGYRAAIDPVFLAASVQAEPGERVIDVGAGVGAASFCLAARMPECRITGIERQRDLVRLAGDNAALNQMSGRVAVMAGDLLTPPPRLAPASFDHAMANPPFLETGTATPPPNPGRAAAHFEGDAPIEVWVRFALMMVKPKGSITFIHRADRLEMLLAQLAGRAGEIVIFPLWPRAGQPAKRVVVRARKQVASPTRLSPGLVLHQPDGRFTPEADAVLRHAAALEL